MLRDDTRFTRMVLPGNVIIERGMEEGEAQAIIGGVMWHRYQMPAYHLIADDGHGITLVNIGVGPSNAKNITDHLAVLRPHCWLMIGHCGGLRQSQRSEEHTSELQSLMRISYAVFCLKKNKQKN